MGLLGLVGGHSILAMTTTDGDVFGERLRRRAVRGAAGEVWVLDGGSHVILQRHGLDAYVPAPRVDHARNLSALAELGCDRVLALSSVGSLRPELAVGTHLVPDDFIALDQPSRPVFDDARGHVVPGFTASWRAAVLDAWSSASDGACTDGGVYWQSNGPRFETPAEIRLIAGFADVVGMTIGSECVAANELGLDYAAVCIVDNLANGLEASRLTFEEFEEGKRANEARVAAVGARVIEALT
jgi:5'-methylthioadenosine phosphorylase